MTAKKVAAPKKKPASKPTQPQQGNKNVRGKGKMAEALAQSGSKIVAPSSPTETPEHKAKMESGKAQPKTKATSAESTRAKMVKPALDAKKRQDHINRISTALENDLVNIQPRNDEVQVRLTNDVEAEPISAVKADGLMEHRVGEAGNYRILLMADANAVPTLAQRVEMARNIFELHGKLPYIKTIELRKPEFHNAEIASKREAETPAARASNGSGSKSTSTITNGVPLKKICADINVDPKIARRILRTKGKKPGGRWEWPADQVEATKKLIKDEAAKLAGKE